MIHTTSILLTWLLAASAGGAQHGSPQELAAAREKWAAQKIETYEFTFQASCFCEVEFLRPVTFRVDDGVSVLLTDVPERVRGQFGRFDTVEKLFDFVGSALDQRSRSSSQSRTTTTLAIPAPCRSIIGR